MEVLPFQSELIRESEGGCALVLYARDSKQRKVVVVVREIHLQLSVDLTKASAKLGRPLSECREILLQDAGKSAWLGDGEVLFPFHEYAERAHEYQSVRFADIKSMNNFIERFNARETQINVDNSYLAGDEYGNSYMYKLARECDVSLCDWCEVRFREIEEKNGVVKVTAYGMDSIKQVDATTVFDDSKGAQRANRLLVAYWDIETYTGQEERQVNITQDVTKNNNLVSRSIPFVIGVAFFWSDSEELHSGYTISTVRHSAPDRKGVTDLIVATEREALTTFIEILSQNRPDVMSGFNDNSFDWCVILNRCEAYSAENLLTKLYNALSVDWCLGSGPKKVQKQNLIREQRLKIKGDESITCNRLYFRGCLTVDTMCLFRKMYPNDDRYSLNHFLTKLGLQQKDDVSYAELERFRKASTSAPAVSENMANMGRVVQYCFNDSALLQKLWQSRKVLQENRELAKASFTDLEHAFFRANGGKVRNMVIGFIKRFAKDLGVSNTRKVKDAPSKYQGAHVFEVCNYLNREEPTACLDFNSLYPSIIMAYNFSPEKIAVEGQGDQGGSEMRPISVTLDEETTISGKVAWHFNAEERMGVYARILKRLFERRVGIKDEMSAIKQAMKAPSLPEAQLAGHRVRLDILDTQQLALKVLMNTFYGEAGNALSPFYNVLVAASVTKKGQELIKFANSFVGARGWSTKYGDTDSLYIAPPKEQLQAFDSCAVERERWTRMVDFTIASAKALQAEINAKLCEYTETPYLKMAYEKVLFPVVFFSKKVYCGYKHEHSACLEAGKEDLSISGFQIKKKGNAKVLEKIGLKLIHTILQPGALPQFDVLVRDVLDEQFSNPSLANVDDFSITQTYRKEKNNIRINQFIASLPEEYKVEDLAKFDYVFVRRSQYDEITGKKIPDSKARHMLLKCMYDPANPETQLDYYQYITGSIKGVLLSVLKLKYPEDRAEQIIKETIARYENAYREGMAQTKKEFQQRRSAVMSELKKKHKTLYKNDKLALHFFEKTILGSTNSLLRHIAADIENDLGECESFGWQATDALYREAFDSRQEIINCLSQIRDAHAQLEGDPSKPVRCTALIVKGFDVHQVMTAVADVQSEIQCLWDVITERYKFLSKIVTTIETQLDVPLDTFRLSSIVEQL